MEKIKNIILKLLYPHWLITFLTSILSVVGLVLVFKNHIEYSLIAILSYIISFYSLVVIVLLFIKHGPKIYKKIATFLMKNKYIYRFYHDLTFKTNVLLYSALAINLSFVVYKLTTGILYNSIWFIVLAFYYLLLVIIRIRLVVFTSINKVGKNLIAEHKQAIKSSLTLLLLNINLIFILILVIIYGEKYVFPGVLIYIMAFYTFYSVISSLINMIKFRKYKSPVISTSRIVSMAASLIMLLGLETALLAEFNVDNDNYFNQIMIGATGIVIALTILGLSLYKIIKSVRYLKKIKKAEL